MVSEQHSALCEGLKVAVSHLFESDSVWACSLLHLLCGTYEVASTDTVSNAGLVHITGADTCIVVASQAGNTNYVGSMAAPERAHHNHQSGRHHDSHLRCGSLHLPGSAITPCSPSVTGPGRLNHSLMVSYQNNANAGRATSSASHAGPINNQGSSAQKYFIIDKATYNSANAQVQIVVNPYLFTSFVQPSTWAASSTR